MTFGLHHKPSLKLDDITTGAWRLEGQNASESVKHKPFLFTPNHETCVVFPPPCEQFHKEYTYVCTLFHQYMYVIKIHFSNSRIFSKIDLQSGFLQVLPHADSCTYIAFYKDLKAIPEYNFNYLLSHKFLCTEFRPDYSMNVFEFVWTWMFELDSISWTAVCLKCFYSSFCL